MPRLLVTAITLMTAGMSLQGQGAPPTPRRIAASSFATEEVHINARPIGNQWYEEDASLTGPARIAITYSQPHARGRKIVGGLIPTDTVWRFGANTATALHTDIDLTLGSLAIPRGDYTLFLLHRPSGWQLIVSRATAQWGTDYDATRDLGRITLTPKEMRDNEETLTIYLVPDSQNPRTGYASLSGVLRVRWGTTELSALWSVKE